MALDRFGSERADDDYARGDTYRDMFLETASLKDFFNRDPAYRYVLGTMGAGKSILLLKMREHIESLKKGSILLPPGGSRVYTPSAEFANSVHWAGFWKLEKRGQQDVNAWTQMWEWALLRCIVLEWLRWARATETSPHIQRLENLVKVLGDHGSDPFTAIAEFVTSMGDQLPGGNPKLPPTRDLREFIESFANDFPPTYVFIDSQDDFFQDSPDFWTTSALGCKYAVDQVVRRSNHRIHILMTLRPEMLWRKKMEADAMRHHGDMFRLEWTQHQLIDIFMKRAALLRDDLLRTPGLKNHDPFAAFFGKRFYDPLDPDCSGPATIDNYGVGDGRPITERLEQYLYRHTLGRPREMILLGNHILDARLRTSAAVDDQSCVRSAVAQAAHTIALAYIGEIKQRWPWKSTADGSADISLKRFLRDYVRSNVIETENITMIERDYLDTCLAVRLDDDSTPFSVLASAGLVGWPIRDKHDVNMVVQYFPQAGAPDALGQRIPMKVKAIVIHPVLYGAEFAIQTQKGLVVGPGVSTDLQTARQVGLM